MQGVYDKHQTVEEPDEVKVSCPVLVRRESRAFSAKGANDWEAVFPGDFLLSVPL